MNIRYLWAGSIALMLAVSLPGLAQGQRGQTGPPRSGFRAAPPIFQRNCGSCHGTEGSVIDGRQAPSISALQEYSPERVYEALTIGKMKSQADPIPDVEKRQIAEFLSGRPMGSDATFRLALTPSWRYPWA